MLEYNKFKNDIEKFVFDMTKTNPENISSKQRKLLDFWEKLEDVIKSFNPKKGSGLKILTKKQMRSRLPTLLAQIQAGNNSKKIKNEIRQILHSS